jgi:hypothetical protein
MAKPSPNILLQGKIVKLAALDRAEPKPWHTLLTGNRCLASAV